VAVLAQYEAHMVVTRHRWESCTTKYKTYNRKVPVGLLLRQDPKFGRLKNKLKVAMIRESLRETFVILKEFTFYAFVHPDRLDPAKDYTNLNEVRAFVSLLLGVVSSSPVCERSERLHFPKSSYQYELLESENCLSPL
jgi:hypothetical protein